LSLSSISLLTLRVRWHGHQPGNSPGPFKPYLNRRWNEGITDASVLHAELQARGWRGSARTVCRYVRPITKSAPEPVFSAFRATAPVPARAGQYVHGPA